MTDIRRVGIDLAKRNFHLTVVDVPGEAVERKRLRRARLHSYPTMVPRGCVVGAQICCLNSWSARQALRVRLETRRSA